MTDYRDARVLVVSPVDGGSLGLARYSAEAFTALGVETRYADFSWLAPNRFWERAASDPSARRLLVAYASTLLVAELRRFSPDLCFVLAQAPVDERALEEMRRIGSTTAFWFVENERVTRSWTWLAPQYDHFFTVQRGAFHDELRRRGVALPHWLPLACSPSRHRPLRLSVRDLEHYRCDVAFAGYGYFNRREVFAGLADCDLKIWGTGWQGSFVEKYVQKGGKAFREREFLKVASAAKIHVNLHSATHVPGVDPEGDYLNPRVFELAACEGFQLVDRRSDLPELFRPGAEIPVFRDLNELRSLIEDFLAHPERRREIARAARRRALADHTYEKRMARVLELTLGARARRRVREDALVLSELPGFPRLSGQRFRGTSHLGAFERGLRREPSISDEEILLRLALPKGGEP